MDYRYRWKNGYRPSRDEAAHNQYLLDEGQFNSEHDRMMAEQDARKHLGVPIQIPDDNVPLLPRAASPEGDDSAL